MPNVEVICFREDDGTVPVLDWLLKLKPKAQEKCMTRLDRLGALGHELRRPEAEYLRDGIHELRIGFEHVNYRILYFFHGRDAVVVSHGIMKERAVPPIEIERAIRRKAMYNADPGWHGLRMERDE